MRGSLRIAKVAQIGIFIHWTFWLLVVGVFAFFLWQGGTLSALLGLAYVAAIFLCVVLHELGHALTARRFNVPTRDITLYPIGGVARLQRIPEEPGQEFWIAIAGPAVNVVIAALLAIVLGVYGVEVMPVEPLASPDVGFFVNLMWINIVLVAFNMLPAFPMDGGRVLRSLLAANMDDYARATQIASNIGKGMAALFGLVGLIIFDPILLFIALFVYIGAQQEAQHAMMRTLTEGITVRQAMIRRFVTLSPYDTLDTAINALLEGSDQDFPLVDEEGRLVGLLTRNRLLQALSERNRETRVEEVAQRQCFTVNDTAMLREAFVRMQEAQCATVPVVRHDNELVGLLTLENVGELMMISSALEKAGIRGDMESVLETLRNSNRSRPDFELRPPGTEGDSESELPNPPKRWY